MVNHVILMEIVFPLNYPFSGPSIKIITPLKHECIGDDGSFNLFRECWSPAFNLGSIIVMIKSKLSECISDFDRQRDRVEKYKCELILTASKHHHHSDY